MKHSDLKVGMKVKRVSSFCEDYHTSTEGNISEVEYIHKNSFTTIESGGPWVAEYFEPVQEIKEEVQVNKITLDKKYRTRCGYPVRVLCVDMKSDWPVVCIIKYPDGTENTNSVTIYGKDWDGEESDFDLIEVSPWEDFKKDDKVMVKGFEGGLWSKRHFAYEKDGRAYVYQEGMTSWSSDDEAITWKYCRKPTEEELAG